MAKHTPGPSELLEDHTAEPEVMAQALLDNPSWVAVEDNSENGGRVAYCAPENAPLIADAPAMLKALEIAFNALRSSAGPEERINAADTLRALIAKHMDPKREN